MKEDIIPIKFRKKTLLIVAWPLRPLAQPPLSSLVVQLRFSCNHNARILLHFILNYLEIKGIIGGMGDHFS